MQRLPHPTFRGTLAALGATAAVLALSTGTATAVTYSGVTAPVRAESACPSGDVCVYPGDDGNGTPEEYYRYGNYNLRNQYGYHYITNNQTGGAVFRLCTGYNGQGCGPRYGPGSYEANLTPINSIRLEP